MRYRLFRDDASRSDIPWIVMFPEFFLRIWWDGRHEAQAYESSSHENSDWFAADKIGGYRLVDKR